MIRHIALVLALLSPMPALALSCLPPSVERSYAEFDAAEETYVVVLGRLTLNTKRLPKGMKVDRQPPRLTRVDGKLHGHSLTSAGFSLPFEQNVTLEVACFGPWCGGAKNGENVLAFVRKDPEGYAVAINPCGGSVFGQPKPAMLKKVRKCFAQKDCSAG